jgi:hypothetical protein
MLFPKSADVTRIWKQVVAGVIDDRLGCTSKVATDDGSDERLSAYATDLYVRMCTDSTFAIVCVYTKNFQDAEDVLRVLHELETMDLVNASKTIYYKSDAYTYLDLKSGTAAQYGLQASLYNSRTLMTADMVRKASSLPQKKQSTLNKFF